MIARRSIAGAWVTATSLLVMQISYPVATRWSSNVNGPRQGTLLISLLLTLAVDCWSKRVLYLPSWRSFTATHTNTDGCTHEPLFSFIHEAIHLIILSPVHSRLWFQFFLLTDNHTHGHCFGEKDVCMRGSKSNAWMFWKRCVRMAGRGIHWQDEMKWTRSWLEMMMLLLL